MTIRHMVGVDCKTTHSFPRQ